MLEDFDFSALDLPGYKEDAVREDIIAPILRKAGYKATGPTRMERSKTLVHPFVKIGSKQYKINIIPDYTLYHEDKAVLVLEGKAPNEEIVESEHVEQTYSYAIHQDIRCQHYALCNGRRLAFYDISKLAPLLVIECTEVISRWNEVEKYLLPKYLLTPELREFHADLGLQLRKMGYGAESLFPFDGFLLQLLTKSRDGLYTVGATCKFSGLECMVNFDFGDEVLRSILAALPAPQATQIRLAMRSQPYSIDLDCKVVVSWEVNFGELVHGPHEDFVPFNVKAIQKIDYVPANSVGQVDPLAVQAGVKLLQV